MPCDWMGEERGGLGALVKILLESEKAKIMWDIEMCLEKAPGNHANKIDIAMMDKEKKNWLLLEDTVCTVGNISERNNK